MVPRHDLFPPENMAPLYILHMQDKAMQEQDQERNQQQDHDEYKHRDQEPDEGQEENNESYTSACCVRPGAPRRSTHPYLAQPPSDDTSHLRPDSHSRNRSPYSRTMPRSRSGGLSPPMAPPMIRAHSLPSVHSAGHLSVSPRSSPTLAPVSPGLRSPARVRSPFRVISDDTLPGAAMTPPLYDGAFESIHEDAELDLTPRAQPDRTIHSIPLYSATNPTRTLASRRQRPTSPLHTLISATPALTSANTPLSSSASSPSIAPPRFNDVFPTLHHYNSNSSFSSMPSTPTSASARSRSPSISSLETIEDAPDLESEAIEVDRVRKLQAEADEADSGGRGEMRRRSSLEIPGAARTGLGFGFARAGGGGRKRWSVCGGERRADLDLETIWED